MNITKEESGNLTALVHINLKEEDYIEKVNQQLKTYRKEAKMPGFRPGMVPMGMIKRMYGKAVLADEVNKSISDGLNNYLYENKIHVVGNPLPNEEKTTIPDFDKQKEFDFFFDIGIAPEVEVNLSEDIKIPYYKVRISDEDVEKTVASIRKRLGKKEHPEKAGLDDTLEGKFVQVDEEGNDVENGYSKEGSFDISDIGPEDIRKKFVDIEKGSRVVFNPAKALENDNKLKILLGLSDGDEKLNADYAFEIKDIIRTEPAELNEEFFKQVVSSSEPKTVEEFKNRIREDLSEHYKDDADRLFVSDTIDFLLENVNPELPDKFLRRWLYESNKEKTSKEQIDSQYDSYARTFKWQLIEEKLIETHGDILKVTREDIRNRVKTYFQIPEGGEPTPEMEGFIDQFMSNEKENQHLYDDMMNERYIIFFKEKIGKEEKEVALDEFIKLISIPKQ